MTMEKGQAPRVCVVTPVFNTARYLPECIESVLAQTYRNLEYLIADNASTDDSLSIARAYAEEDDRIHVIAFDEHLDQIPNYNRALRAVSGGFDYCKVVQADDIIFPNCLAEMISIGESDPDIRLIGGYTILQNSVFLDGLDYSERVLDGKDVCRRYLLDGSYLVGSQTTSMYRMSDVRSVREFYPEDGVFADTDAAFRLLMTGKFGFVHQVLSVARVRSDSLSDERDKFFVDALTRRIIFERHGRQVLSEQEYRTVGRRLLWRHRRILGKAALSRHGREFWAFHRRALKPVNKDFGLFDIAGGALVVLLRSLLNLESLLRGRWP